ncbi:hypothetical protein [Spirosoma flavum]|uniref:Uncharacterized protein n=1 Tax=Spirosoma flavum TaxID=2048557 RepID=A0ABW6ATK4_9BACT
MRTNFLHINLPDRPRIIEVGSPLVGLRGRTIHLSDAGSLVEFGLSGKLP